MSVTPGRHEIGAGLALAAQQGGEKAQCLRTAAIRQVACFEFRGEQVGLVGRRFRGKQERLPRDSELQIV
jgi:hypothetical protein